MELAARVRASDAAAFEQLVYAHWGRALLYASHLLRNRDEAPDVVQEAFVRLWQRRDELRPEASVVVWIFRTIRNLGISEHRRRKAERRWRQLTGGVLGSGGSTPLREVEREELRSAIDAAVASLSPRRREVFTLFHLENLSYREISDIMGVRPQTVANYLQAALADLRAALKTFFPTLAEAPDAGASPPACRP